MLPQRFNRAEADMQTKAAWLVPPNPTSMWRCGYVAQSEATLSSGLVLGWSRLFASWSCSPYQFHFGSSWLEGCSADHRTARNELYTTTLTLDNVPEKIRQKAESRSKALSEEQQCEMMLRRNRRRNPAPKSSIPPTSASHTTRSPRGSKMAAAWVDPATDPRMALTVVRLEGNIYSLNNRRLTRAQLAQRNFASQAARNPSWS
eukprot:s1665_g10.t1